jgi:hypothetical protein
VKLVRNMARSQGLDKRLTVHRSGRPSASWIRLACTTTPAQTSVSTRDCAEALAAVSRLGDEQGGSWVGLNGPAANVGPPQRREDSPWIVGILRSARRPHRRRSVASRGAERQPQPVTRGWQDLTPRHGAYGRRLDLARRGRSPKSAPAGQPRVERHPTAWRRRPPNVPRPITVEPTETWRTSTNRRDRTSSFGTPTRQGRNVLRPHDGIADPPPFVYLDGAAAQNSTTASRSAPRPTEEPRSQEPPASRGGVALPCPGPEAFPPSPDVRPRWFMRRLRPLTERHLRSPERLPDAPGGAFSPVS